MTRDAWLTAHPYLNAVAALEATVEAAADEIVLPCATLPDWNEYDPDFAAGVPLLHSSKAAIELADAEHALRLLVNRLSSQPLPGAMAEQCLTLEAELRDMVPVTHPGLLRYLRCTVLERYLRAVVRAFAEWREDERWLRKYCPVCGATPAMGQLIGKDPGRLRLLSCGCCRTRWRYRRTGCPFCEIPDDHRLSVVAVEGEAGLRIDYCRSCRGYLKTYNGEGSEALLLDDWTSLHLDLVARDRGLKRLAASLYEL
jgi:FdhE protein